VKNAIALFFILISQVLIAQNYRCVNSGRDYLFQSNLDEHMLGLHIDSITINNGDSIFKNYLQLQNPDLWSSNCTRITDSTWVGVKVIVNSLDNYFINKLGDTVLIKPNEQVNNSWTMFRNDSVVIEATIDSISTKDILGNSSNIKYISMNFMDTNGTIINHDLQGQQLMLSEDFGLIETYSFFNFPADTERFSLVLKEKFNAQTIFDFNIGDVFHTRNITYLPDWGTYTHDQLYEIKTVTNKAVSNNGDTIIYGYDAKLFLREYYSTPDTVISDTTIYIGYKEEVIILSEHPRLELFANQITGEEYSGSRAQFAFNSTFNSYQKSLDGYGTFDTSSNCVAPYIDCGYDPDSYAIGLGKTYQWFCNMCLSCNQYYELVYAKKGNIEYGTPLSWSQITSLGEESQVSNLNVFPNPFSDKIEIQLPSNADYFIQLLNSIGQIIYSEKLNGSRTSINTEQLPSGAYFLRINSDQTMETVQLIK